MLIFHKIMKYNATLGSFAEDESLIEKFYAIGKEVTKFL